MDSIHFYYVGGRHKANAIDIIEYDKKILKEEKAIKFKKEKGMFVVGQKVKLY